jgi:Pyridoxamine 5'-phosphate oxidase
VDLPPQAEPPAHVREFLERPLYAVISTVGAGRAPHQAVIWYRLEPDGRVLVNSRMPRRWPEELGRERQTSLAFVDLEDPLRWVGMQCVVEAVIDDVEQARDDIVALSVRYGEEDEESTAAFRSQQRISFLLRPIAIADHLGD